MSRRSGREADQSDSAAPDPREWFRSSAPCASPSHQPPARARLSQMGSGSRRSRRSRCAELTRMRRALRQPTAAFATQSKTDLSNDCVNRSVRRHRGRTSVGTRSQKMRRTQCRFRQTNRRAWSRKTSGTPQQGRSCTERMYRLWIRPVRRAHTGHRAVCRLWTDVEDQAVVRLSDARDAECREVREEMGGVHKGGSRSGMPPCTAPDRIITNEGEPE